MAKSTYLIFFAILFFSFFLFTPAASANSFDEMVNSSCGGGSLWAVWERVPGHPVWVCKTAVSGLIDTLSVSTTGVAGAGLLECGREMKDNAPSGSGEDALRALRAGDLTTCEEIGNTSGAFQVSLQLVNNMGQGDMPISLGYYVNKKAGDNILIPVAHAGTGGSALAASLYSVWETFRNLAYLFFVLIIIAAGFMVMFRKQIDPRTVVTVQNALPRLFLGLLLITFSYGIGALAISTVGPLSGLALRMVESDFTALGLVSNLGLIIGLSMVGTLTLVGGPLSAAALFISLLLIAMWVVVLFLIFIQYLIRVLKLTMLTIAGPAIILVGTVPGQGGMITNWFKGLLVNVLAIPAMWFVFKLSMIVAYTPISLSWIGVLSVFTNLVLGLILAFYTIKVPGMIEKAFGYEGISPGGGGGGRPS